jgi:hypothetical protein
MFTSIAIHVLTCVCEVAVAGAALCFIAGTGCC